MWQRCVTTTGPTFQNVRGEHIESISRLPQQMTGLRALALLGAMTEVGNGLLLNVFQVILERSQWSIERTHRLGTTKASCQLLKLEP